MSNISQRVGFDVERSLLGSALNGTLMNIGSPLQFNPVVIVFDNQTNGAVPLSVNGVDVWKTFSAGEAFVLDLRANHGIAANYTIDLGTQFSTSGAAITTPTGSFRISIVYAI
jgi:hypothetical protein